PTKNSPIGSVRVTPGATSSPVSSFSIFSYQNNGVTVSTTSSIGAAGSSAMRIYTESSGVFGQTGSVRTALMFLNPSAGKVTAQMNLMKFDGTDTGFSALLSISAGGQASKLITDLFPQMPSPFQGYLRVTAPSGIVVTSTRNRYNERSDLLLTDIRPYSESS